MSEQDVIYKAWGLRAEISAHTHNLWVEWVGE